MYSCRKMSEEEEKNKEEEDPVNWDSMHLDILNLSYRLRDAGERMVRVLQEHKIPEAIDFMVSETLAVQGFVWTKQGVGMQVKLLSPNLKTQVKMPGTEPSVNCATFEEAVLKIKTVLL